MPNTFYQPPPTSRVRSARWVFLKWPALLVGADLSLVCFTLATQSAVGLVCIRVIGRWLGGGGLPDISFRSMIIALTLTGIGLCAALAHLARPRLAPLALYNPATSWLSREVLLVPAFAAALALAILSSPVASPAVLIFLESAACLLGAAALFAMTGVYRLKTVPAWNTPATGFEFAGSAMLLGGTLSAVLTSLETGDHLWQDPDFATAAIGIFLGLVMKLAAISPAMQAERVARNETWYPHKIAAFSAGQAQAIRWIFNLAGLALILGSLAVSTWPWSCLGLIFIVTGEVLGRVMFYRAYRRIGL